VRIIRSFTSCEAPTTIEPVSVVGIIFWAAACAMPLPSASQPTRLRRRGQHVRTVVQLQ